MESCARNDIKNFIADVESFLPDMIEEKVRQLLTELEMIEKKFEREIAVMYLSSNYSSNKHLAMTILRGMSDADIKNYITKTKSVLQKEIALRRC